MCCWSCVGVCVGVRDSGIEAELSNIVEVENEVVVLGKEGEIVTDDGLAHWWAEEDNGERVRERGGGSVEEEEEVKLCVGLLRKGEG